MQKSLQEIYAPQSRCFGCGPANPHGLKLQTTIDGDQVVATWQPQAHHEIIPGVLNGGIIGTLLDCFCNWTAAYALMQRDGLDQVPPTVTAEYKITMHKPTPTDRPLDLRGEVVKLGERSVQTRGVILADGKTTATCEATFVVVKPDHPAYHRWESSDRER